MDMDFAEIADTLDPLFDFSWRRKMRVMDAAACTPQSGFASLDGEAKRQRPKVQLGCDAIGKALSKVALNASLAVLEIR